MMGDSDQLFQSLYQGSVADRLEYMQFGIWCRGSDPDISMNNRAVGWSGDVKGAITDRDATASGSAVNGKFGLGVTNADPDILGCCTRCEEQRGESASRKPGPAHII